MEYVYNESSPPVGRVYGVHPREGERFYLRLLLMKIAGPTSFDDLKTTYDPSRNPARIIQAETDAKREEAASKMGFSAYGVTQNDDPVSQAMRGLIDNATSQEHQIALLWKAIEQLSAETSKPDCVPSEAARQEHFQAARINQLLD